MTAAAGNHSQFHWKLKPITKVIMRANTQAGGFTPAIGSKTPAFLMPETHHSKRAEAVGIAWGSKFLLPIVDLRFC